MADKGKPVERRGRKTTGLSGHFEKRCPYGRRVTETCYVRKGKPVERQGRKATI